MCITKERLVQKYILTIWKKGIITLQYFKDLPDPVVRLTVFECRNEIFVVSDRIFEFRIFCALQSKFAKYEHFSVE